MKKITKLLAFFLAMCVCFFAFILDAFAASGTATISCDTQIVKGSKVKVKINIFAHNEDPEIWYSDGVLAFNSTVLKYSGVSKGLANEKKSGEITFSFTGNQTKQDFIDIEFTAIATGKCTITLKNCTYSNNGDYSVGGQSAAITVSESAPTTSKPTASNKPTTSTVYKKSNNANLTAIMVSGATLSPEFSKSVTEYSAIVENSTEKVTIGVTKESSKATVSGTGEVALQVGENPFNITVTAEDGTKKLYTLKIKRATIEESLAQNALATVIGGKLHHIVADLSAVTVPAGFSVATGGYNGKDINVLKSDDGSMTLYQISRDEDGYVDFYRYLNYRDEFVKINYITVNNIMYILPELPEKYTVPDDYYEATTILGGTEVVAFCSKNEALKDFYVIYCFANGEYGFYRFDTLQTTIQRAPEFSLEETKTAATLKDKLLNLSGTERILLLALLVAIIIILVLAILLICGVGRKKVSSRVYDSPITEEDLNDFFKVNTKSNN